MIEFHFTNPFLETSKALNSFYFNSALSNYLLCFKDRKDSSGVRLYVTNKLRQEELGILSLGSGMSFYDLQIPPKTQNIQFTSACYPECFDVIFCFFLLIYLCFLFSSFKYCYRNLFLNKA